MKKIAVLFLIISLISFSKNEKDFLLQIGGGGSYKESIYLGVESKLEIIPFIYLNYRNFEFDFSGAKLKIFEKDYFSIKLLAAFNSDGYESSDSEELSGLDSKEGGILGGIEFSFLSENTGSQISFSALQNSHGLISITEFTQIVPFSKSLIFIPKLKFKYMNSEYGSYYYGVNSHEESDTINIYKPENGHLFEVELAFIYMLSENITLMPIINYEVFSKEIEKSPIVEDFKNTSLKLVITYII